MVARDVRDDPQQVLGHPERRLSKRAELPPKGTVIAGRIVIREAAKTAKGEKRALVRCQRCGLEALVTLGDLNRKVPRGCKKRCGAVQVGDHVTFDAGGGLMVDGTVVEDRGCIGVGGRRLWAVDYGEGRIELGEADLRLLG